MPVLFFTRKSSVSSFSEPSLWCEEGLPLTEAVLLLLELSKPSSFMLTGWAHYCTLPIYCISIVRFYAGSISSKTESCVAGQKFVVITTSIQSCSFVAVLNLFLFLAKFLYLCSILLSCLICDVLCQKCWQCLINVLVPFVLHCSQTLSTPTVNSLKHFFICP